MYYSFNYYSLFVILLMLFILTQFFLGSTSYLIFENKFNFFHNLSKNNNNLIEIIFIQIIFIEIFILILDLKIISLY